MARELQAAGSDYISLPTADFNGQSLSVHFKLERDGTCYLGNWHSAGSQQWLITADGSTTIVQVNAGGSLASSGVCTSGQWSTVGLRLDDPNNLARMFTDGVGGTEVAFTALSGQTGGAIELGRAADVVFSDAKIAEVAIWLTPLSDAEFAALAKGANPQTIRRNSLWCYLPLYGTGSPERDYSGNGRSGTLVNTPAAYSKHPPVAPFIISELPVLSTVTVGDYVDAATVYLNLEALVTEEYPVVPLRLTPSGTEGTDRLDSATVPLTFSVLGGECYSTFMADFLGEGEATLEWSGIDNLEWSSEENLEWSEGEVVLGEPAC